MRYHLGCGTEHLEGYVNADLRSTPEADLVLDLSEPRFPEGDSVDGIFSHAFFEHLRRDARVPHLKALHGALAPGGFVCYLGLPDFRRVAELYLAGGPGVVGPHFDLFNVYRYTHGDPEMFPEAGWEPQLHKSLFDVDEVELLLRGAGFASYAIFRYVYPGDPPGVDLTLGFYAVGERVEQERLQHDAKGYLAEFDGKFIDVPSIDFAAGGSRSAASAAIAAGPQRPLLRRAAYGLASILARNTRPV